MVIVTDKKFYMNEDLKALLDLFHKRETENWDNVMIIDGKERSGKSSLAQAIAYYYAHTYKKKFTLDNVFFDPEKLLDFAQSTERQIIVWDEAAFGGQASEWQNKALKNLNTALMVTGKFRHFYIFIIPSFFLLHKYLAKLRSEVLIHVYSPDMLSRGYFACYNSMQKTWVYNNNKKSETYGKSCSFRGRYTIKNVKNVVLDEDAYEKKKNIAIAKFISLEKDKATIELRELKFKIASALPPKEVADLINVTTKTVSNWLKYDPYAGNEPKKKSET